MKFTEGAIDSARGGLVFLAPAKKNVPSIGWRVRHDDHKYQKLLHGLQKLRGQVYLEDGAVTEAQLTSDGRHWQPLDSVSWHLLAVDEHGDVSGCARYSHYPSEIRFDDLGVRTSALARCDDWGHTFRVAVEREVGLAHHQGVAFAEVGGWAISTAKRFTTEALRIALATYGLAQLLGGCLGLTTATSRHHSAQILRRIGGRPLNLGETELPPYYDPQYRCEMEVLRFDSSRPEPAYRSSIECLRNHLLSVTVVAPEREAALPHASTVPVSARSPLLWPART